MKKINPTRLHQVLGWVWMTMLVPTLLWWSQSVLWVATMSLYANVASEFAARHAAAGLSARDVQRIAEATADVLTARGLVAVGPREGGDRDGQGQKEEAEEEGLTDGQEEADAAPQERLLTPASQ